MNGRSRESLISIRILRKFLTEVRMHKVFGKRNGLQKIMNNGFSKKDRTFSPITNGEKNGLKRKKNLGKLKNQKCINGDAIVMKNGMRNGGKLIRIQERKNGQTNGLQTCRVDIKEEKTGVIYMMKIFNQNSIGLNIGTA